MSQGTPVQPSLSELFAGYLEKQANARSAGIASVTSEVTPYEVGPVQPLDPKLAWDESLAVLTFFGQNVPLHQKAPPHWSQLVAGHESIVAIPFCAGNFPQLMRNFHAILSQPKLSRMLVASGRPANADELGPWAEDLARKKQYPQMLLALGTLRLAKHFDDADRYIAEHDASIPAEWRASWDNEKAALAWHRGSHAAARQMWDAMEPTIPVLFNRGMAALFADDSVNAKKHLSAALAKLPATSAWHHLARLYLTLADLRRA